MSETTQIIQQLTIHLKGGQTVAVQFKAEKAELLNPQIDAFMQALGDKDKQGSNFLFQGARVVLVRISDVSAVETISMIQRTKQEDTAGNA
ncbi:MAG: hypothetical protein IJ164_01465 [Duodenibacillus sp.]|nr:hypothetical protein [Duodenibacillus sp.]